VKVCRHYIQEHLGDISNIPGWIRSRRFRFASGDGGQKGVKELLAIHEFEKLNGLDGPEHQYAKSRPWRLKIVNEVISGKENKIFDFFHTFKAQDYRTPRPLNGLNHVSRPRTGATSWRIDGCEDQRAPLVVFSNSLLTDLHIWDATIARLARAFPRFRFLRYNTRGYESPSNEPVNTDLLGDDLAGLLDVLGEQKCSAVVGVSLGGITCMNFAIRYPSRLDKYIACDCNVASSVNNSKAWKARVALAQSAGGWAQLADQTVERWFTAPSIESHTKATFDVRRMILSASVEGFVDCVAALCDFNLNEEIKGIQVPGLYVVGKCDGVLPQAMAGFAQTSPRASFVEIRGAGHLPMVEQPEAFTDAIYDFLRFS
jgi:3-oxoadipate enol-lactonase